MTKDICKDLVRSEFLTVVLINIEIYRRNFIFM